MLQPLVLEDCSVDLFYADLGHAAYTAHDCVGRVMGSTAASPCSFHLCLLQDSRSLAASPFSLDEYLIMWNSNINELFALDV